MVDLSIFSVPTAANVIPFMSALEATRACKSADEWRTLAKTSPVIRSWRFFLSMDPYTRWGAMKPRGYPGDATLMDFAYGHHSIQAAIAESGPTAATIYAATSGAKQSQSARDRIDLLRTEIVGMATHRAISAVSVAAGHARELEEIPESVRKNLLTFTAIDLDSASLQQARESARSIDFRPIRRNVLKDDLNTVEPGDLVYSLGLFDYLTEAHGVAVLSKMLALTKPGGKCIVANLATDAANLGYCEAIMDWWMITRSESDMLTLADSCAAVRADAFKAKLHRRGCFHYLELVAA